MNTPAPTITFSEDQAAAWDSVEMTLRQSGVDLNNDLLQPPQSDVSEVSRKIRK